MEHLKSILSEVQKPGRYIGEEINMARKKWGPGKTTVALAYPDLYEVGMSYLGMRLLYHLLNENDATICERVFAPGIDMESVLKKRGVKLFSLENKKPICDFDIVGFSLSYELNYTNVLNMLALGGVSIKASEREANEPIVIAGGACCFNPEPMSDFIDVFIIGEAEESFPRFIRKYSEFKKKALSRSELLLRIAELPGVYVPSLYKASYDNNRFSSLKPLLPGIPETIKKSLVRDLENAYYPVKQIVPYIKIVHDRLTLEIMRGCPNKCRFCQASVINRPVRVRSIDKVRQLAREGYKVTGYEQIALLSLSSGDYPGIDKLISSLMEDFPSRMVSLSVPSLRIDKSFYSLPEMMSAIKKTGLTFAPETASDKLRKALGKNIHLNILSNSIRLAYKHGWRRVKLYFMTGFPGEREEEVMDIVNISRELSDLRKEFFKSSAEVKVSVNAFIPKPHTPFQWLGMKPEKDLFHARAALIRQNSKKIQISVFNLRQAELEAAMARGDRRLGKVIYSAWEKGAVMDGTLDHFTRDIWDKAFEEHALTIDQFARHNYSIDDPLPWDHIITEVNKNVLIKELMESGFYKRN